MAYRWGLEGPAFEFKTPYATENRFLRLRGYVLVGLAVVVMLVLAVVPSLNLPPPDSAPLPGLGTAPLPGADVQPVPLPTELSLLNVEGGSITPHLMLALLMAAFGVFDFVRASRQKTLLLAPGQPASLTTEVRREATGASAGVPWLMQILGAGAATPSPPEGRYRRGLRALLPAHGFAPQSLYSYLQLRLSQAILLAGLCLLFGLGWLLVAAPAGQALIALWCAGLGALVVLRGQIDADRPALAPAVVLTALVVALAGVLALAWVAPQLPGSGLAAQWRLPLAAALLLGGGLLLELLALWAGRTHADLPAAPSRAERRETLQGGGDPVALMQELDHELLRRWTEGIPNRRHAWQPPQVDAQAESGSFNATVLEESQPMAPAGGQTLVGGARRRGPLLLDALGLLATVLGALLWLWLAYSHMRASTASWAPAGIGLACLALGLYAVRLAHLLWSRTELESTLTCLEFEGRFVRLSAEGEASGRGRATRPLAADPLTLRAQVVRVRSVFYAAATHLVGSRVVLHLVGDPAGAQRWADWLRAQVQGSSPPDAALRAAALPAEAASRTRPRDAALNETEPPRSGKAPRYCPACATPVLQGARFCQHCGNALTPG